MILKRKKDTVEPVPEQVDELTPEPVQVQLQPRGTVLAEGVLFKGHFESNEPMVVHGSIQGNVQSTDDITFTGKAHYEGDIHSRNLTIAGEARGRFACKDKVEILEAGKIEGKLHAARFVMSEDSVFDGDLKIEKPKAPKASAEEAAAPEAEQKEPKKHKA